MIVTCTRDRLQSLWMVFTDRVTHACTSDHHAFIDTFIIPLENCGLSQGRAPYNPAS